MIVANHRACWLMESNVAHHPHDTAIAHLERPPLISERLPREGCGHQKVIIGGESFGSDPIGEHTRGT